MKGRTDQLNDCLGRFSIGHFRVPLCFCFKASLTDLDSFSNRGTIELGNGLLNVDSNQAISLVCVLVLLGFELG